MKNRPLWMPTGSVRSILALGVVLAAAGGSAFLLVENSASEVALMIVGGWTATLGNVIAHYFTARANEDRSTTDSTPPLV